MSIKCYDAMWGTTDRDRRHYDRITTLVHTMPGCKNWKTTKKNHKFMASEFLARAQKSFCISAPKTWNSLPLHIRQSQTYSINRRHLKIAILSVSLFCSLVAPYRIVLRTTADCSWSMCSRDSKGAPSWLLLNFPLPITAPTSELPTDDNASAFTSSASH